MADYGGVGGGQSLRDALNQLYPLTNLGGISTGFPPGGMPPRVGMTAQPVPAQGGPVIPSVPPVPGPMGAAPPNPQDDSAQAQLLAAQMQRQPMPKLMMELQGQQGPPNYAAQLGLTRPY